MWINFVGGANSQGPGNTHVVQDLASIKCFTQTIPSLLNEADLLGGGLEEIWYASDTVNH